MPIDFDNYQEVKDALTTGKGVYPNLPYFILSDGSVRDVLNHQHLPANALRADLCSAFAGFLSASAPDLTGFVEKLVDITDTAPDVEDYALGDRYFNTSDKKLYVLEAAAAPEGPNAWAEADPNITTGKLYLVPTGENAGLYAFDGIDTLVILELTAITGLADEIAALADLTTEIAALGASPEAIAAIALLYEHAAVLQGMASIGSAAPDFPQSLIAATFIGTATEQLVAVTDTAPPITYLPAGARYFNTTSKKFFIVEDSAWVEDDPSTVSAGGTLYFVFDGHSAVLYRFDGVDTLELL